MFLQCSVSQLRVECADYIHSHSVDFLPYLTDTHTGEMLTEGTAARITASSFLCPLWAYSDVPVRLCTVCQFKWLAIHCTP